METEEIKSVISTYFRNNNLSLQKLPQVYILYRALQKIGKCPTLVKGYLVNHSIQVYCIYFWVVCDGQLHNIVDETLTYSFDSTVELVEALPKEIETQYVNMNPDPSTIQNSFNACLESSFLDDLYKTTHTNIYHLIERLYLTFVS